jgi:hypothetical protein
MHAEREESNWNKLHIGWFFRNANALSITYLFL